MIDRELADLYILSIDEPVPLVLPVRGSESLCAVLEESTQGRASQGVSSVPADGNGAYKEEESIDRVIPRSARC